ncbi:MAG: hypothetical protein COV57_03015 [Candidatus Liptonbacteria bacterium CG11_big_fil_rev_8_21_14_0_20_35_14]|uniref:Smf/DprA SLOG domain-containing protein n=1 Tax=Candidatus Liptonbacteria bacterium CG11_big_fil_rev_8_21_14_0_20_35_14 TaxID=1974634 RepID=A0A2H0N745_9BACT|nr:MAG: hypothetical protein COV57_03015 [Candidatus Liptonbacteria bacterium CG11_big_fil_rev_8_21_14_0_20_35_14]
MSVNIKHIPNPKKLPELKKLNSIQNPPKELYAEGKWRPEIFQNCIAIVGSRRLTAYGKRVIETLIPKLVWQGQTIVSGMMYGADQYAHEKTIENGGVTIGILGWGINNHLKNEDKKLAQKIIKNDGLIISEWKDLTAARWTFPARNRIIAGLSDEIYVIEAALKSGSLITANLAKRFNRKLWAVPGPITSHVSRGTNLLISEGKADMYLGEIENKTSPKDKKITHPILSLLLNEPLTINEISRHLNKSISEIGAELSLLAIEEQVLEQDSKYYLNQN